MIGTMRALLCGAVLAACSLMSACTPGTQTSLNTEIRGSDAAITRANELQAQNSQRRR